MRIGNGPRLVVPRPGGRPRRWDWYGRYKSRGELYDQHRAQERERLRNMPRTVAGDVKTHAVWIRSLKPGEHYRLVDGHGRTFGPRLTAVPIDRHYTTLVRRVDRQPEDYHSLLSRMLKRAHKTTP